MCAWQRRGDRDELATAGRARPAFTISERHDARLAAKSSTSGSVRRRTRRAPNGSARIPPSTRRSARASATRSRRRSPARRRLAGRRRRGALARVLLLDQFTRNVFRDTPRAFAGDRRALATAIAVVDAGRDRALDRFERWFLYLPFEHAEDPAMQQRSIALFTRLADETGDARAARMGGEARGDHSPLRPLSASQRDPRPRVDARGNRFPRRAGIAVLARDRSPARLAEREPRRRYNPGACARSSAFSAARSIPFTAAISSSRARCARRSISPPCASSRPATRRIALRRSRPRSHRLAMVELAIAGHPGLEVDAREIQRRGRSYTVHTLEELRSEAPARALALIVGADAFLGLPDVASLAGALRARARRRRRAPGRRIRSARCRRRSRANGRRASATTPRALAKPAGAIIVQPITAHAISASAIRAELARGAEGIAAVRGLLPAAVLAYIDRNQLYRSRPDAT